MDEFLFCLEIIKREVNKFNLTTINSTTASHITAATSENINYDIAVNRCLYLYRCGAINLCFIRDCFTKFFSEYKSIMILLFEWISQPNLTVCSLSNGPGLDYIAFLLSYQKYAKFPLLFKDIKVISKYGAWRNTVNIMQQIITEGNLRNLLTPDFLGKIEVIQGDPFKDFTQKVGNPISNSDVLLMVKKLNLQSDLCNQDIKKSVQEFLAAMKPDAILFCIDTKPSVALITNEISSLNGVYLLKPTVLNTAITLELRDFYKEIFGCPPVISARGSFFVWQKSMSLSSSSSHLVDEISESVKQLIKSNGNSNYCDKSSENNCNYDKFGADSSYSTIIHALPSSSFIEKYNELFVPNENLKSLDKESENNDLLSPDSANVSVQNLRSFSSSSSLKYDIISFGDTDNTSIKEKSSKNVLINKSTQTEPVLSAESVKIADLTERIINLTATVNNLLETNQIDYVCSNDCNGENHGDFLKQTKHTGKGYAYCDCGSTYSPVSCLHKCQENGLSNSSQDKNCEKVSSCGMHKQDCLPCNQFNSSTSLDSKCDTTSCHQLKISAEKKSVPKLVIPLTNLPGDVIAQIISLISQSNSELEKL